MSNIGFYRIKLKPSESREVEIYNGDQLFTTIDVIKKDDGCCGGKYVKYLDKYGRFRFWQFNDRWKESIMPMKRGSKSSLINSLLDSQSNARSLGYKSSKRITLRTGNITQDERDVLSDIFTSPRVYYKIGDDDEIKDWILCSEVSGDNLLNDNNKREYNFEVTLKLPDYHSVRDV